MIGDIASRQNRHILRGDAGVEYSQPWRRLSGKASDRPIDYFRAPSPSSTFSGLDVTRIAFKGCAAVKSFTSAKKLES